MKSIMSAALLMTSSAFAGAQTQRADVDARYERASQEMMQSAVAMVRSITSDPKAAKFRAVTISPGGKAVCGEYNARNKSGEYAGFYRFIVTPNMLAHESAKYPLDQREWVNKCLSDGESVTNK